MAITFADFVKLEMPQKKTTAPTVYVKPLASSGRASGQSPSLPPTALVNGKEQAYSSTQEKFHTLARIWSEYNAGKSVTEFHHAAYLQIIGMGRDAIPFLLREVARGNGNWLFALRYITGTSVTTPQMRGNFDAISRAWLEWGSANGFGNQLR